MPGALARPRELGPRKRLTSLGDQKAIDRTLAEQAEYAKQAREAAAQRAREAELEEPCCDSPNIRDDEAGPKVCDNCGMIFRESGTTNEVEFGENAAGAAVVQGGFIGDGQRHANSMGGTVSGIQNTDSLSRLQARGNAQVRNLCAMLNLPQAVEVQASRFYSIAIHQRFQWGRNLRVMAAVVIYAAARRRPHNTLLLMDLSEVTQTSVWELGRIHAQFVKACYVLIDDPVTKSGLPGIQQIEPLMLKFCQKLEFGDYSQKVAEDAVRLLKRMNRDWMVDGRNPAGLCGACIIIAAGMNNFRRTVREVVYVVKVADTTVNMRLHEFRRTKASTLTVTQFRDIGVDLKDPEAKPPSVYKRIEREERKEEAKRKRLEQDEDTPDEEDPEGTQGSGSAQGKKKRKVANGKAQATVPALPTNQATQRPAAQEGLADINDPELDVYSQLGHEDELPQASELLTQQPAEREQPKKRGRPPKKAPRIVVPDEELEIERELEMEITDAIREYDEQFAEIQNVPAGEEPFQEKWIEMKNKVRGILHGETLNNVPPKLDDAQLDDDDDVKNCLLNPQEIEAKSRVWLAENEDWLRANQAKLEKEAMDEINGVTKQKTKRKGKRSQLGDGSLLGDKPADSTREAAEKMLLKRGSFSKQINYQLLNSLLPKKPEDGTAGASPAESGGQSTAQTPAQTEAAVADADENEEEEEEGGVEVVGEGEEEEYEEGGEEGGEEEDTAGGNYYDEMYDEDGNFIDPRQFLDDDDEGAPKYDNDDY
ncbi:hypothetical protein EJ04DRAFT_492384 [Polyplosphaeria fusca]|uniref:B-related factor 1 n=1 Tax=Polyplosphaeria fusca TaxID=682080 RepID=A0A9P4V1Z6_9PLEO|nr:hypothetical protein EJ04DRAFT_492384 [Polyplosphaeria fusca]